MKAHGNYLKGKYLTYYGLLLLCGALSGAIGPMMERLSGAQYELYLMAIIFLQGFALALGHHLLGKYRQALGLPPNPRLPGQRSI
jgi:hypothetical protein